MEMCKGDEILIPPGIVTTIRTGFPHQPDTLVICSKIFLFFSFEEIMLSTLNLKLF